LRQQVRQRGWIKTFSVLASAIAPAVSRMRKRSGFSADRIACDDFRWEDLVTPPKAASRADAAMVKARAR